MVISASSSRTWRSHVMRHRNGVHSRTFHASSKIHLDTLTGRLTHSTSRTVSDLCGPVLSTTCITHSYCTCWSRTRRRIWLHTGATELVRLTTVTALLTVMFVTQPIALRTMFVTPTSIRFVVTRDSAWFTLTGGAVTKISVSTSKCARSTTSVQLSQVSTTKRSTTTSQLKMPASMLCATHRLPSDLIDYFPI